MGYSPHGAAVMGLAATGRRAVVNPARDTPVEPGAFLLVARPTDPAP